MTNETLARLHWLLECFHGIIAGENGTQYSLSLRTIERMQRNVRTASTTPCDADELFSLLKADWRSLYPPKSGLTDFYLWHDDYAERLRLNKEYEAIRTEIDTLLQCRKVSSGPVK